jgi:glycosyltransferase involved in cell wall biosynthesis
MAAGTPVISGNLTSLPEVIGDAAMLVDPHDVTAIASAIVQLVRDSDLRSLLRERGLDRAKRFPWEKTAQGVLRVLQSQR